MWVDWERLLLIGPVLPLLTLAFYVYGKKVLKHRHKH